MIRLWGGGSFWQKDSFWTMANYTTVDCLCFFDSDVMLLGGFIILKKILSMFLGK